MPITGLSYYNNYINNLAHIHPTVQTVIYWLLSMGSPIYTFVPLSDGEYVSVATSDEKEVLHYHRKNFTWKTSNGGKSKARYTYTDFLLRDLGLSVGKYVLPAIFLCILDTYRSSILVARFLKYPIFHISAHAISTWMLSGTD